MLPRRSIFSVALCAVLLLCLGVAAQAQEQDRKLLDRLTRPNMSLEYNVHQSTFGDRSVTTNKVVPTKDFGASRSFVSKDFYAKPYLGSEKRSWLSNLFFPAKSVSTTGKYEIPNAGQKFDTKAAPSREYAAAAKTMATTPFSATDLQYLKRNRFDTSLKSAPPQGGTTPLGYSGDMRPMSIDDVRELLNKNK